MKGKKQGDPERITTTRGGGKASIEREKKSLPPTKKLNSKKAPRRTSYKKFQVHEAGKKNTASRRSGANSTLQKTKKNGKEKGTCPEVRVNIWVQFVIFRRGGKVLSFGGVKAPQFRERSEEKRGRYQVGDQDS